MPRRTVLSNHVWVLEGGTEDNDLWAQLDYSSDGTPVTRSTFVPTDEQRERIWRGENIELVIWGNQQPPVLVQLSEVRIGKTPEVELTDEEWGQLDTLYTVWLDPQKAGIWRKSTLRGLVEKELATMHEVSGSVPVYSITALGVAHAWERRRKREAQG